MVDPFDFLRRDLERISRALGPNLLPATFQVAGRTFIIGYTSLKESPPEPGTYIAETEMAEVGRGIVGGVSLHLKPQTREAGIEWASVIDRRKGIGRAMVQAVEKDLASRGYREVTLHAVPDSIPFWKRLGYRAEGEEVPGQGLEMSKRL